MNKTSALSHYFHKAYLLLLVTVSVIVHLTCSLLATVLTKLPGTTTTKLAASVNQLCARAVAKLNQPLNSELPTDTLIMISERNLTAGKARTRITISAISLGIAITICLVSIGYGLEEMVISRVAKLDQLKQVDITPKPGSTLAIDETLVGELSSNTNILRTSPAILLPATITYQGAKLDVPAMGTTPTFLSDTGWQLESGKSLSSQDKPTAVATTALNLEAETADTTETVTSPTTADEATQSAVLTPEEQALLLESEVPGSTARIKTVTLPPTAKKEVVINMSLANSLGKSNTELLGSTLEVQYVLTGQILRDEASRVESESSKYTIIGIVEDKKSPFMYVSLGDLQSLGVQHYSQLKTVLKDSSYLEPFRASIETAGYATSSITDTVNQIKTLFSSIKLFLGSIGAVALGVAALGMFNTLTVSLLERTREIGLLKALGMVSEEIERLFLIEALLISLKGGFYGVILGWGIGEVLGLIISLTTIPSGFQLIDISSLPVSLLLVITLLSIAVGLLTGLYPAKRATKITALNALRYE